MKMSDILELPVSRSVVHDNHNCVVESDGAVIGDFITSGLADEVIHAINSHDQLVDENIKLRQMLSECYPYIKDKADWGDRVRN